MSHKRSNLTGGQVALAGFLYQLMVSLDRGMSLGIGDAAFQGEDLTGATLRLEPRAGGDLQVALPRIRIVEQFKIRTNGKPWTSGDIAETVLPDLVRAVDPTDPLPTRYRFVTNGELACDELLDLAARARGRSMLDEPLQGLDDVTSCFNYGGLKTERGFFEALASRAEVIDRGRLWALLAGFEAEGELEEDGLVEKAERFLRIVVDCEEDVENKRHELISRLADLARNGAKTTIEALFARANLPIGRMHHAARLPAILSNYLERDMATAGYLPEFDVRAPPEIDSFGGTVVLAGEGGTGKSWALGSIAKREREQGRLAVLLNFATSIDRIETMVAERIWHSGPFDQPLTFPSLARRLSAGFSNPSGIWLTVCVDDVQEAGFARQLLSAGWERYGIRLVFVTSRAIADGFARGPQPSALIEVGSFSLTEVRRFLERHGLLAHRLPDDVRELLRTPIIADIYRRIGASDWHPTSEYVLVDRFWRQATYDTREMADYQDDVIALQDLALRLLAPGGMYPWPLQHARAASLTPEARRRLVAAGVLRQSPIGIVAAHDRILNWLVAVALAQQVRLGQISALDLVGLIERLENNDGTLSPVTRRLGYVMLDLVWLLAGLSEPSSAAAFIRGIVLSATLHVDGARFIEGNIAEIGIRILPVLTVLADDVTLGDRLHATSFGKAIASVGTSSAEAAARVAQLFVSHSSRARDVALDASGRMPVPQLAEQLWQHHLRTQVACHTVLTAHAQAPHNSELAREVGRYLHDARVSFRALATAVRDTPDWIVGALNNSSVPTAAEELLRLLIDLDADAGRRIWRTSKMSFLGRLPAGNRALTTAVGRFRDCDELDRLERSSPDAELLEPELRFIALVRLSPQRALRMLDTPGELHLGSVGGCWLLRLMRVAGDQARDRLLTRFAGRGWEGMRDLALVYSRYPDLIDARSLDAMLDALEFRLAEVDAEDSWVPRGEGHILRFLARLRSPCLLARLEARRNSRFESLLLGRATRRQGRVGLSVDSDGIGFARILLMIGGRAYSDLVAAMVVRQDPYGRVDGYEAALHLLPEWSGAAALGARAQVPDLAECEHYALMVALAAQGLDEPLSALVRRSSDTYKDALDLRGNDRPFPVAINGSIRKDLASDDSDQVIGALCLLIFAPPADAIALVVRVLNEALADSDVAITSVRMLTYLGGYQPECLPQLERMLSLETRRREVRVYLAQQGDAAARLIAAATLPTAPLTQTSDDDLQVADALARHEDSKSAALAFFRALLDRGWADDWTGYLASRLFEAGQVTISELIEYAYTGRGNGAMTLSALHGPIIVHDSNEAFALAERSLAHRRNATAAWLLLATNQERGLDVLLRTMVAESSHAARWVMGRALRWHANRNVLLVRLAAMASSLLSRDRQRAAELLGWLPDPAAGELLDGLADDNNPDVGDEALISLTRRSTECVVLNLYAELDSADHLGRWSRLMASIEAGDPHLMEHPQDPVHIEPHLEKLGAAFRLGTKRALKARKKALEDDAARRDRAAAE